MKKKLIFSSILSIVMCFSLICGATFALFTSEDKVNIAVTSGTVSVMATATKTAQGSTLGADNDELAVTDNQDGTFDIRYMIPNDYVEFEIAVTSASNVDMKFRIVTQFKGELAPALALEIADKAGNVISNNSTTEWKLVEANTVDAGKYTVKITFPEREDNNDFMNKNAEIEFKVEAIQGNGVISSAEDLRSALKRGGSITLDGTADAEDVLAPFEGYPGETVEYYVLGNKATSVSGGTYTMNEGAKYGIYADTAMSQGGSIAFSDMKINANSKWSFVIENAAEGSVSVSDVEIIAQSGAGLYGVGGKVTLTDVKVNHLALDPAYSNTPWGATALAAAGDTDMTINSGEYYGSTYGLYVYSSGGTVTINGGTFKAPVVVAADAQNGANAYVNINGGNFDGKFESVNVYGGSEALITINGGNFTNFSTTANKRITIKGGTFDANPTQWLADGYKAIQVDGKYYVSKAENVINDATAKLGDIFAKDGKVFVGTTLTHLVDNEGKNLTLDNDVELYFADGCGITFDKTTVINGSGTLTVHGGELETQQELCVSGDATLIIEDGEHTFGAFSATGNGTIIVNGGTLNCEGSYAGILGISFAENGKLIVNDGTLNMGQPFNLNQNRCDNAYIEINGGTINLSGNSDKLFAVRNIMDKDRTSGVLRGSSIKITGGVFNAPYPLDSTGDANAFIRNEDGTVDTTRVLDSNEYNGAAQYNCVVTGGTFYGCWTRTGETGGDGTEVCENTIMGFIADGYVMTGNATDGYKVSQK